MIYTITISPAIDYVVHLDEFRSGMTNRSSGEEYFLGGKGINVSQILKELGMKSVALGFTNGFTAVSYTHLSETIRTAKAASSSSSTEMRRSLA